MGGVSIRPIEERTGIVGVRTVFGLDTHDPMSGGDRKSPTHYIRSPEEQFWGLPYVVFHNIKHVRQQWLILTLTLLLLTIIYYYM